MKLAVHKCTNGRYNLYSISHAVFFREPRLRGFTMEAEKVEREFTEKQARALKAFHIVMLEID